MNAIQILSPIGSIPEAVGIKAKTCEVRVWNCFPGIVRSHRSVPPDVRVALTILGRLPITERVPKTLCYIRDMVRNRRGFDL